MRGKKEEEEQRISAEIRSKISRHTHKISVIRSYVGIRWGLSSLESYLGSWLGRGSTRCFDIASIFFSVLWL